MNKLPLKITGGVVGILMLTSVYTHIKRKQQDKLASRLLQALHKIIKPASSGLLSEEALDIHYLEDLLKQVNKKILTLNKNAAIHYAEQIESSWGAWYQGGDNEAKVYAVFRALKDKVQVAQVARAYQNRFGENLIEKLQDRFGEEEIKTVLNIIKPLPKYRSI